MKTLVAAIAIAFTLSLGAADKLGGASKLGGEDKISISYTLSEIKTSDIFAIISVSKNTDTKIAKGLGSTKKESKKIEINLSYKITEMERYYTPIDQAACKTFLEEKLKSGISGILIGDYPMSKDDITLKDGSSLNAALVAWVRTQMELAKSAPKPPKEQAK